MGNAIALQALALAATASGGLPSAMTVAQSQVTGLPSELARLNFRVYLSKYATADVKQIFDVATTSGSAVITSATANFTAADVGKVIRVTNAKGTNTKLYGTILSRQSATQVTLSASATATVTAQAATYGVDAGPGLQAIFDLIFAQGVGGAEIVVDGAFMLATPVSGSFLNKAQIIRLVGNGLTSRLHVAMPGDAGFPDAITVQNCGLYVEAVAFVGTSLEVSDCGCLLNCGYCDLLMVNCDFYWLSCALRSVKGLVLVQNGRVYVDNCRFLGCSPGSGLDNCAIAAWQWAPGSVVQNCRFIDYGLLGGHTDAKTPLTPTLAWIRFGTPAADSEASASVRNDLTIRNVFCDEGALYPVMIGFGDYPTGRLLIDTLDSNVDVVGNGIQLLNVQNAEIRRSFVGFVASGAHVAVSAVDCRDIILDKVKVGKSVVRLIDTTRQTGTLTVRDCDNTVITVTTPGANFAIDKGQKYSAGGITAIPYPVNGESVFDTSRNRMAYYVNGSWFEGPVVSARAASYRDAVMTDTPLYYWPMDEGTAATSLAAVVGSTALTLGTSTAKPTGNVAGRTDGTCFQFDGGDYAASAAFLNLTAYNKLIVEFWLWWDAYANNDSMALEFGSGSVGGFYIDPNGASGGFQISTLGNVYYDTANYSRPTAAAWHHVAAVFDYSLATNEPSLYVDGAILTPTSRPNNSDNTGTFGNLGLYLMSRGGSQLFGAGKMQHLAIYNTLSAARILAHYNAA